MGVVFVAHRRSSMTKSWLLTRVDRPAAARGVGEGIWSSSDIDRGAGVLRGEPIGHRPGARSVKATTRNALNSIGAAPICLGLNKEIYPDDFLRNHEDTLTSILPSHDRQIQISVSAGAWSELRDICQSLLKARRDRYDRDASSARRTHSSTPRGIASCPFVISVVVSPSC